ncbi:MAG: D-alanine--D-alanine ligase [Nitrospirae bacterium RBG_13_39_12]|nr:MAG: D-alanine--D-alanine ligase [Nitrospirae bacterium RBG_13_39_12]
MLTDKRVGVLMGGTSAEREISLKSGAAIYSALKGLGYNAVDIDAGPDVCIALSREKIEIAFLALHGGHGENGSVQGMLEVLGIPYTGSGVLASALAMDKEASKKVFVYHNIPVPPFIILNRQSSSPSPFPSFNLPWVVKPATEGSSVGVSIVRDKAKFEEALEKAFSYSSRVILEKYIGGKEVHIGILNDRVLGGVEVRPSLEFYNYKAKYTPGLTEYILPPEINKGAYEKAKEAAFSAHVALGCKGATRMDLRIDTEDNPYVLEVNTIPGMTETSLLPKIASLAGFDFPSLIEEIIRGAVNEGQ